MKNLTKKLSVCILILSIGCSIEQHRLYLFPATPEGEAFKQSLQSSEYGTINVVIRSKNVDAKKLYDLIQEREVYELSDKCYLEQYSCITIKIDHNEDCKIKRGLLTVTAEFIFEPRQLSERRSQSLKFIKKLSVHSENCQINEQEKRSLYAASIELIRNSILPQYYKIYGPLDEYFYFKSDSKELQALYNEIIEESRGTIPSANRIKQLFDEAELHFPKDAWLIRNIGTAALLQGDWQRGCAYYKRSAAFGHTDRIEKWLEACEQFDFRSVL